jgi:O-antigen/teichoic acid export membrane protein
MTTSPPARFARGFAGVSVATTLGNAIAYVLVLSAARLLPPHDYRVMVTLLNLLLVGSVPSFALQAVIARRIAISQTRDLVPVAVALAIAVGAMFAVISPALQAFLNLPDIGGVLLISVAVPIIAMQGFCQGVWQGSAAFGRLSMTTAAGLLGRNGGALLGLVLLGSANGALAGLVTGSALALAISVIGVPRAEMFRRAGTRDDGGRTATSQRSLPTLFRESRELTVECGHAAHAYGAFLLLSTFDVLLASHLLASRQAALYAAGSVMTKATLWLPQSLANVLFASMTDRGRHKELFTRGVAAVAAVGGCVTAGCLVFPRLATTVVAGRKYPELHTEIWVFAALGALLAVIQFSLVTGLALRSRQVVVLIWLTLAAEICFVLGLHRGQTMSELVTTVTLINACSAALCVLLRVRSSAGEPAHQLSTPGHGPGANTGE